MTKSRKKKPTDKQRAAAAEILRRRAARTHLLDYMKYVWWNPYPLIVGYHTSVMASVIDKAVWDFEQGRSSFIIFKVPFRHGKTDMVSKALPPYFLGRCGDRQPSAIVTGYGAKLAEKFSRRAKPIMESAPYRRLFKNVRVSDEKKAASNWQVEYRGSDGEWRLSSGEVVAAGLSGALTGSGYELGVVDDFCKNREEAESDTYRDKMWDSLVNEFLTRRGPVSITLIIATPWNVDDLFGRIEAQMLLEPSFPRFKIYSFPARGPALLDGRQVSYTPEQNGGTGEYLFGQRFPDDWYTSQEASLGPYYAAGLLHCCPKVRSGNMLKVDKIKFHETLDGFPNVVYVRFWDLASTAKERHKRSPDFTAGALVGIKVVDDLTHIWVKDIIFGRWEAPERNSLIVDTAEKDGKSVKVVIEQSMYKDAVDTLRRILRGVRTVEGVVVPTDKVVRASYTETIFAAGNVHFCVGEWNGEALKQLGDFPATGTHDDLVDAIVGAFRFLDEHTGGFVGILGTPHVNMMMGGSGN